MMGFGRACAEKAHHRTPCVCTGLYIHFSPRGFTGMVPTYRDIGIPVCVCVGPRICTFRVCVVCDTVSIAGRWTMFPRCNASRIGKGVWRGEGNAVVSTFCGR